MQIQFSPQGQAGLISAQGSIDALTAPDMIAFAHEKIGQGNQRLVLDLSKVEFMSSAGLRAILVTAKECRSLGGDLRLAAPQAGVEKVLKMSGFISFIKNYPAVQEALESFNQ